MEHTLDNKVLIDAIEAMKKNPTDDTRNAVIEEIVMNAKFYMPAKITALDNDAESGENRAEIQVQLITANSSQIFFPAFTGDEELRKWNDDYNGQTLSVSFDDIAIMLSRDKNIAGFVIDPFGVNLPIDRTSAESFRLQKEVRMNGMARRVISEDSDIDFKTPEEMPEDLLKVIKEYLSDKESVNAAYYLEMEHEGLASHLVVIDVDGNESPIFTPLLDIVRPYLGVRLFDLVRADSGLGRRAVAISAPFYKHA